MSVGGHEAADPECLFFGRYRGQTRQHMLNASSSHFDPMRKSAALAKG
jgi:hypothetical protein